MTKALTKLADMRRDYRQGELIESAVAANPMELFTQWMNEAQQAYAAADGIAGEVNAMTLATVGAGGQPSARIVLLKDVDDNGFVFYTNYDSRKGKELAQHAQAALLLHWGLLERQVRVEGAVEKVSAAQSDAYYQSRPLGSRIGAWASPQSQVIASRETLEHAERDFASRLGDSPPRPQHWGGYRVKPTMIEFWQGRSSRLHDRLVYTRTTGQWAIQRLAP
jgi:pyridoxamine 5'-phosphate oxidase